MTEFPGIIRRFPGKVFFAIAESRQQQERSRREKAILGATLRIRRIYAERFDGLFPAPTSGWKACEGSLCWEAVVLANHRIQGNRPKVVGSGCKRPLGAIGPNPFPKGPKIEKFNLD